MVTIQIIDCGIVNCYLIKQNGKSILIDTARTTSREKIWNICKSENIQLIVLTHGHIDHIQNTAYFAKAFNVPIAMNKEDSNLIENNLSQTLNTNSLLGKFILKLSVHSFKTNRIEFFIPTIYLKDGDSLEKYGFDIKVIGLEGHTKGSIGLDIQEKSLIVGDALMNMLYPCTSMIYEDRERMLESACKISKLGERIIYFGHGKPVKNRQWK